MNKEFVTVYILIYNNYDGLEATVNSLLKQDYENAEVIISDDGSSNYDTNNLNKYADSLKSKFKEVRININEHNLGTVKHLNKVFKMAKGEILVSCCSGDEFAQKTTITDIVREFDQSGKYIITSRRIDRYPNRDKIRPGLSLGFKLKFCPKYLLNYMIRVRNVISGCCTFYKKEVFEKYGYLDERYFLVEDYPFYIKLLRQGISIGFMGKATIIHTIGGVSTGRVHPAIYKDIEFLREDLYKERDSFSKRTKHFLEECHAKQDKDK